ncbi:glycosyltransferase [Acinetobacter sp. NS-4]|uniref:glycosyltransferase family 2 protein n=1 Tax=Acinetobacter sp. NS-4 TaxID=3127956 RepID=UPI00307DBB50
MTQNNNILLSIIIPVYNVENVVTFCINSIFNQNLNPENFEVILINDGSKDNSYNVCLSLSQKHSNIRVLNQENSGQSVARNRGIDEARGLYLNFIDSDDYIIDGYMNEILKFALREDCDFIGFGSKQVWSRKNEQGAVPLEVSLQGEGNYILSEYNYNNGPWWYIFKKEKLGSLRFISKRLCEDGLFTAELIAVSQKVSIIKNVVYCYVDNPESTVNTKNVARQIKLRDDMFFAASHFNSILMKLDKSNPYYQAAYQRLKERQETYIFYGLIRCIKTNEPVPNIMQKLAETKNEYPIKKFSGYGRWYNKVLIFILNNKFLLSTAAKVNHMLKIVK